MSERRFNETEVADIFARATSADNGVRQLPSSENGMTLAQLQDIGREVGIEPQRIAEAAGTLDRTKLAVTRTVLGLPVRVERVISLDRKLSDAEWERVVAELRDIFDARGTMRSEGTMRQWTNGNLHVFLEPTATGQRIRMRTVKGSAQRAMVMGLGMAGGAGLAIAALVLGATSSTTGALPGLTALTAIAAGGVFMMLSTAIRLPGWARQRSEQMEEIGKRVGTLELSSGD